MPQPKFVDHYPAHTTTGYYVTNEEPYMFNDMLGKTKRFNRAACIVSGGEVLLSVILRRAKEVVGVDHSYLSLSVAYAKLLLLQKLSPDEIVEALTKTDYKKLQQVLESVKEHTPQFGNHTYQTVFKHNWGIFRTEWCHPKFKPLKFTNRVANRLTLVHGDLRDLRELYGTFDLLYMSNAMEHIGRNHTSPTLSDCRALLNPEGTLLYTCSNRFSEASLKNANFQLVAQQQKTYNFYNWSYVVARKMQ